MFDDELKYCPECRDEYRPEISQCAVCNVLLLTGLQMRAKFDTGDGTREKVAVIAEGDTLIPLMRGRLLDLKQVKILLAGVGVPALLVKDDQCRSGCCGGPEMMLQIRWQDQEKAEAALQQEHERTTGHQVHEGGVATVFDPEAEVVVCPACGHEFSPNGPDCPDCGLTFLS